MIQTEIKKEKAELIHLFASDKINALDNLIDFAEKYTIDNELISRTYVLKIRFLETESTNKTVEISDEFFFLIDEIEQNYKPEEIETKKQQDEKIVNYFKEKVTPKKDIVFQCKDIEKTYKRSNFTLKDIELSLRLGEITGVVGENGQGKTTLFKIISGLISKDKGQLNYPYLVNGNLNWYEIKNQIAFVPQELPRWYGSLKNNIHYELASHGIKGKENDKSANFIIHRLGLVDAINYNKKWNELNTGHKLRFALAKALSWRPKLLIIDEPLANLDINIQDTILGHLRDLANSLAYPLSILVSSHHIGQIERISDKMLYLDNGQPKFYGEIKHDSFNTNAFLFTCNLKFEEIKVILSKFPEFELIPKNTKYILKVPKTVDFQQVQKTFVANNIFTSSFEDISNSMNRNIWRV